MKKRSSRGFSLIEVMVTLGLSGILGGLMIFAVVSQNKGYLIQLDHSETQQGSRAAVDVLREFTRQAGWGFVAGPGVLGTQAFGTCWDNVTTTVEDTDCDGVDGSATSTGSDRLRIMRAQPTGYATRFNTGVNINNVDTSITVSGGDVVFDTATEVLPFWGLLSGECIDGSLANERVQIVGYVNGGGSPASHQYTLARTAPACAAGFVDGKANFGRLIMYDFFIDNSDADEPTLQLRIHESPTPGSEVVHDVAYFVEDLQVEFGLDVVSGNGPQALPAWGEVPDQFPDVWCDSLDLTASGSFGCESTPASIAIAATGTLTGKPIKEVYNRVIGLRLAIVSRASRTRGVDRAFDLPVQNNSVSGNDGFRRWVLRTSISMRNSEL